MCGSGTGSRSRLFFLADDGIRDGHVTGVQTCALPIFAPDESAAALILSRIGVRGIAVLRVAEDENGGSRAAEVGLESALHAEDAPHRRGRTRQGRVIEAEH